MNMKSKIYRALSQKLSSNNVKVKGSNTSNRFVKISGNSKGITLTEVLAAVAVSTILIAMAAVAIITFYTKFRELSYFAELQQRAFDAVETVKYGYPFPDMNDYLFMGIANARSVELEATSGGWGTFGGIICYPDRSAPGHENDYVRYYYDRNSKSINLQALHGIRFYQEQIFPPRGDDTIEVTALTFASLTGTSNPRVIELNLKAEIIVTEESRKQVQYNTKIALGR